jgi:hypothetical protein
MKMDDSYSWCPCNICSPKPGNGGNMTGVTSYYRFGVLPVPRHEPTLDISDKYPNAKLDTYPLRIEMDTYTSRFSWKEVFEPIEDEV